MDVAFIVGLPYRLKIETMACMANSAHMVMPKPEQSAKAFTGAVTVA